MMINLSLQIAGRARNQPERGRGVLETKPKLYVQDKKQTSQDLSSLLMD